MVSWRIGGTDENCAVENCAVNEELRLGDTIFFCIIPLVFVRLKVSLRFIYIGTDGFAAVAAMTRSMN
jgi:hypothetical protein